MFPSTTTMRKVIGCYCVSAIAMLCHFYLAWLPDCSTLLSNLTVPDCSSLLSNLTIPDCSTLLSNLTVYDNFTLLSNLTVPDCSTLLSNLTVPDCSTLLSNLNVSDKSTLLSKWLFYIMIFFLSCKHQMFEALLLWLCGKISSCLI